MNDSSISDGPLLVVMTGATSGIGAAALHRIASEPETSVLVGARGVGRDVPAGVATLPLDLASLGSVRDFAEALRQRLGGTPVNTLVLNAARLAMRRGERTADGFETTFAVNHLAHYLLARLLAPHLAPDSRLIITTSDLHDRHVQPLGPTRLDPRELAHAPAAGFGAGMRAYAASKLCNVLTARSLASLPEIAERGTTVIAYNPGLTADTNLGDPSPSGRRLMKWLILPTFRLAGRVNPGLAAGHPERAGEVLAALATGALTPPTGRAYVSLVKGEVTYPDPAELARDDRVRDDLWRQSAAMVGLSADPW